MPIPESQDLHVNSLLTDISIAYMNRRDSFIADRVFPIVPVRKQSDRYAVYDKSTFFRARARKRSKGGESAGDGWEIDNTPTYYADRYDFHADIDDDDVRNADDVFNLMEDATEYITHALLVTREQIWASTYFAASVWSTDLAGVTGTPTAGQFKRWDEPASTPLYDIRNYADEIQRLTGYRPNVLVVNPQVLTALQEHPDIIDRFKHTTSMSITSGMLAAYLGLDEVLVANATYDTSVPGATESMSFIAGKHALLVYRAPRPSIKVPSGGYTFSWRLPETGGDMQIAIINFRINRLKAERIEGSMAFDTKVVAADLGVFFENAIS